MSPFLTVFVPCVPVAQPRAKAMAFQGHARVYNPNSVKTALGTKPHPVLEFKHAVRSMVMAAYTRPPLKGPVRVDLECIFPRPASLTRKSKPNPSVPHTKKPDRDNLDKAVLDCLKGVVWVDDCQVCDGRIRKRIAAAGEPAGVRIEVTDLSAAPVVVAAPAERSLFR